MKTHELTTRVLLALILIGGLLSAAVDAQQLDNCSIIARDLNSITGQLRDRIAELSIAHQERDFQAAQAALAQVDKIMPEIRFLQQSLADCHQKPKKMESSLGPVKLHEGEFATLGCDDLRRRHVQISRKLNSLRRQLESMNAETDPEMVRDYQGSEQALRSLKAELTTRCLRSPKSNPKGREWWFDPPPRPR